MRGRVLPLVGAVLVSGCLITLIYGDVAHWIPILVALAVVGAVAREMQR